MTDARLPALRATAVNRRTVLRVAAGGSAAAAAVFGPRWLTGRHRVAAQAIKTISAEVIQEGSAFSRGDGGDGLSAQSADGGLRAAGGADPVFVSEPIAVDFPMTHVAAHWNTNGGEDAVAVDLRLSADGRRWSNWVPLAIEGAGRPGASGDVFGGLIPGNGARQAQYRVRFGAAGGDVLLNRVNLTCLNTTGGERVRVLLPGSSDAAAAAPKPAIVSRAGWGCYEGYRLNEKGEEEWPAQYEPWVKVVFHHTETTNAYSNVAAEIRAIYYYHAMTLGWGDIGYNGLIGNDGRIYEGRKGRDGQVIEPDLCGGHVLLCNYGTMGFSMIGNFRQVSVPAGMYEAGAKLSAWACSRNGINPLATNPFRRTDGVVITCNDLAGHYQMQSKDCPGASAIAQLPSFRQRVASIVAAYPSTATPVRVERGPPPSPRPRPTPRSRPAPRPRHRCRPASVSRSPAATSARRCP